MNFKTGGTVLLSIQRVYGYYISSLRSATFLLIMVTLCQSCEKLRYKLLHSSTFCITKGVATMTVMQWSKKHGDMNEGWPASSDEGCLR